MAIAFTDGIPNTTKVNAEQDQTTPLSVEEKLMNYAFQCNYHQ